MPYASTNYCLCKHWNMLQVMILLILFSYFYMFQAISTRDAIISSWKLYVFIDIYMYIYIWLNTCLIVCAHDCIVFVFKRYCVYICWISLLVYNYLTQNVTSNYSNTSLMLQDGRYSLMYTDVTWWWTTTSQLEDTIIQVNTHTLCIKLSR